MGKVSVTRVAIKMSVSFIYKKKKIKHPNRKQQKNRHAIHKRKENANKHVKIFIITSSHINAT